MILACDPGLDGGFILLSKDRLVLYKLVVPTLETGTKTKRRIVDVVSLADSLRLLAPQVQYCYLEHVASRPGMGAPSVFKFGRVYGNIEGILAALKIPFMLVTPQTWTKAIHAGIEGGDPKAKSRIAASRLYPDVDLRATPRSTTPHEGLMDALLIGEWGWRQLLK